MEGVNPEEYTAEAFDKIKAQAEQADQTASATIPPTPLTRRIINSFSAFNRVFGREMAKNPEKYIPLYPPYRNLTDNTTEKDK